jgi:hypothetical protein
LPLILRLFGVQNNLPPALGGGPNWDSQFKRYRVIVLENIVVVIIEPCIAEIALDDIPKIGMVGADGITGKLDAFIAARANNVKHGNSLRAKNGRRKAGRQGPAKDCERSSGC